MPLRKAPLADSLRNAPEPFGLGEDRLAGLLSGRRHGAEATMADVEGFGHTFFQDVAFRDLDGLGHVNNAVYLSYVESARLAYMREVLGPLELDELGIVADVEDRLPLARGPRRAAGGRRHRVSRVGDEELRLRASRSGAATDGSSPKRSTVHVAFDYGGDGRCRFRRSGASRIEPTKQGALGSLMPNVFEKTDLPNGLRVVTAPMPQAKSVACFVMLAAGSRYETQDTNGIAHFAEHMFFKGTERRPTARDIAGEIDSIGGEFNAFTGKEYTGYYVKCAAEHRDTALDVLVDMLRHSKFDPEEIEREKGVIVEEMNMYYDTPRDYVEGVYDDLLYGDTPLGWDIIGKKETVRAAKRETFLELPRPLVPRAAHGRRRCRARSATTSSPGWRSSSGTSRTAPRARPAGRAGSRTQAQVKVHTKQSDQAHIRVGVHSYPIDHPDRYTLGLLATVLGGGMSSRLFTEVRERRGLAYYVYGYNRATRTPARSSRRAASTSSGSTRP